MAGNTSLRGFAAMSPDERQAAASRGGRNSGGKFKKGDPRTIAAAKRGAAKRHGNQNEQRAS